MNHRCGPVASAYFNSLLDQICRLDLCDYERLNANWITLRDWFHRMGIVKGSVKPRIVFSSYTMAVEAALRGEGVILGSRGILRSHLQSGRLVELTPLMLKTGAGYYVGMRKSGETGPQATRLHQWLSHAGMAERVQVVSGSERLS